MKYSKRYLVFTLFVAIAFLLKFHIIEKDYSEIASFRGAKIESDIWNPLVASSVNQLELKLVIDGTEYSSREFNFYMDHNRNIMIPVDMLRDALSCSAHMYSETNLQVEKHDLCVNIEPVKKGNEYYVSLGDLSDLLSYSYNFDIVSNTGAALDSSTSLTILPSKYDLREKGRMSLIRNQGSYGTCWGFAATSALESTLRPEQQSVFSVDHMTLHNSFNVNQNDGGEYTMGMAYLAAWQGPVYEEEDPYGDGVTVDGLSPAMHVQEMRIIDGKDYDGIKKAVFQYGGVQSSMYSTIKSSQGSSTYYNKQTSSYCYIGTEKPNHDIVIIGWDDNYPKENFNASLEGDGAFICQNSWGENFGDGGVFYVSYYDTNIGTHNVVYTRIEKTDNYDHIYQSDLCGWVGKLGYDKENIYGANVFGAEKNENVMAAGFYATGAATEYRVYFVNDFIDEKSLNTKTLVASGVLDQAGYYTVDFDSPCEVSAGEKYAVVVYLNTPGATNPMAVEYPKETKAYQFVDTDDGEGYISYNGLKFTNVKEKKDCNLCIKAFSKDR